MKIFQMSKGKRQQPLVMTTYDRIVAQGLEKGLEKGIVQGLEKGLELKTIQAITNMHKEGFDDTTIARVLEVDLSFVRHILDSKPDEKNGQYI